VFRGTTLFKLGKREWRPYKASKKEVLSLIEEKEAATIYDLVERFDLSYKGAANRLYLLHKGGLVQPLLQRGTWGLTRLGEERLTYWEGKDDRRKRK